MITKKPANISFMQVGEELGRTTETGVLGMRAL